MFMLQQLPTQALWVSALTLSPALIVILLALLAWRLQAMTAGAAIAGALLTLTIVAASGPKGLAMVSLLFLLTYPATCFRRGKKSALGLGEPHAGRRALQILANLGAATLCLTPLLLWQAARPALLMAALAALAEAAADTVSSEIGQALPVTPVSILDGRPVAVGSNGGITWIGSLSGFGAACLMVTAALWMHLLTPFWSLPVLAAATAGAACDSLLGATLEGPGRLGNNAVNFASSSLSAVLALLFWLLAALLHG
jgi:uncharacterized protein (TIGR00297 family)